MLGLTLWQPWAGVMAAGIKRIENRPWLPPPTLMGQRFALHAGKFWDESADAYINDDLMAARSEHPTRPEHPLRGLWRTHVPHLRTFGAVLAVATLVDVVRPNTFEVERERVFEGREDQRRWFFGRCGWVLEDIKALTPIPCLGRQKLWTLPAHVEKLVLDQFPA